MLAIGTQNYRMDIIFTCFLGKVWSASLYSLRDTTTRSSQIIFISLSLSLSAVTTFERPQAHSTATHLQCICTFVNALLHSLQNTSTFAGPLP